MSGEWLQDVSTLGVALIAAGGTYFAGRRSANASVQVSKQELVAKIEADRVERNQRRRELAYVDLAKWISRFGAWASMTMPMMTFSGQDPFPEPPGTPNDPTVHDAEALGIYWSEEVRSLVRMWSAERDKLVNVSMLARSDQQQGQASALRPGLWMSAEQHRRAMREAEDEIVAQMSDELAS